MDQPNSKTLLTLQNALQALAKLVDHFAALLTRRADEQPDCDLLKETHALASCLTTLNAIDRFRQRRGDDPKVIEHAVRTAVKLARRIVAEDAHYQAFKRQEQDENRIQALKRQEQDENRTQAFKRQEQDENWTQELKRQQQTENPASPEPAFPNPRSKPPSPRLLEAIALIAAQRSPGVSDQISCYLSQIPFAQSVSATDDFTKINVQPIKIREIKNRNYCMKATLCRNQQRRASFSSQLVQLWRARPPPRPSSSAPKTKIENQS